MSRGRSDRHATLVVMDGFSVAGTAGTSQILSTALVQRAAGVRNQDQLPWSCRDCALFVRLTPTEWPEMAVLVIVGHGSGAHQPRCQLQETERSTCGTTGYRQCRLVSLGSPKWWQSRSRRSRIVSCRPTIRSLPQDLNEHEFVDENQRLFRCWARLSALRMFLRASHSTALARARFARVEADKLTPESSEHLRDNAELRPPQLNVSSLMPSDIVSEVERTRLLSSTGPAVHSGGTSYREDPL